MVRLRTIFFFAAGGAACVPSSCEAAAVSPSGSAAAGAAAVACDLALALPSAGRSKKDRQREAEEFRAANGEAAVFGDGDDLGRGKAMQVDFGKAVFDATQQALEPVDFQIGMQASLHQYAGAAKLEHCFRQIKHGLGNKLTRRAKVDTGIL